MEEVTGSSPVGSTIPQVSTGIFPIIEGKIALRHKAIKHGNEPQRNPRSTPKTQERVWCTKVEGQKRRASKQIRRILASRWEAKKLWYTTEKARNDKLDDLERAAKKGMLALVPTRDDMGDWQAFKRATEPPRQKSTPFNFS